MNAIMHTPTPSPIGQLNGLPSWYAIPALNEDLITQFREHFACCGYAEFQPVSILSGYDATVRFIGSTTSVYKPYVLAQSLPIPGAFLMQPALRARNMDSLLDNTVLPGWTSYFRCLGTMSPANSIGQLSADVWSFFTDCLGLPSHRITVRGASIDGDLMTPWKDLPGGPTVEVDSKPLAYYRHRFGHSDLTGRNLNIAIRQNDGLSQDIGNIIVLELCKQPVGVEFATGVGTLLARILNADHPIKTSLVAGVNDWAGADQYKFADALAVSVVLLHLGLRPVSSNQGRIQRAYLQALSTLASACGFSVEQVLHWAHHYERLEFGLATRVPELLGAYLRTFGRLRAEGIEQAQINLRLADLVRQWSSPTLRP